MNAGRVCFAPDGKAAPKDVKSRCVPRAGQLPAAGHSGWLRQFLSSSGDAAGVILLTRALSTR